VTLVAIVLVYLGTWALFGSGSPRELYNDSLAFAGLYQAVSFLDLWYPTSYIPVLSLFSGNFPASAIVGSDVVEWTSLLLPWVIHLTQGGILAALVWAFFRPTQVETTRLVLLAVIFSLITNEAGGYTQAYVLLLTFLERWQSAPRKIAIVLAYVLAIPGDLVFSALRPLPAFSYFAQALIPVEYGVAVGQLIRPGLVLLIGMLLSFETLRGCARARSGAPVTADNAVPPTPTGAPGVA
jgi:hypothetical protein